MTQQKTSRAMVALVFSMIGTPAQAQQPSQESTREQRMSMDTMMRQCREHWQATSASVIQMTKMMNDAERSNDPAKMRQTLQDAQKQLNDLQQRGSSCMSMMDMMHGANMRGMPMMGGGQGSTEGTAGMQRQQPSGDTGMSSGMMCCMPGAGMHGAAGAAIVGIGALLALSLAAALIALTVFLWKRSRAHVHA